MYNYITERMAIILYDGMALDLPGVERDILEYENFLISSYGGSWKEHEIKIINVKEWEKDKIKKLCQSCANKYLLLIFVGHGAQDSNSNTYFLAKRNIQCYVHEINNFARKQVTIVDCCRVWVPSLISESAMEKIAQVQTDTSAVFFNLLNRANDQHITLYACLQSQKASDACSYSHCLMNCAYRDLQGKTNKYVSVERAHKLASKAIAHLQTPEICPYSDSIGNDIPFAITL